MIIISEEVASQSIEGLKILAKNYRLGGNDFDADWKRTIEMIAYIKEKLIHVSYTTERTQGEG